MKNQYRCSYCKAPISVEVYRNSIDKYKKALCANHQKKGISQKRREPTPEAKKLAAALRRNGWKVELEKFDGYKHIDIAITSAMVNIEVDGLPHSTNAYQALTDLKRNYYSFRKGYLTLRIPNCLVENDEILEETADFLTKIMKENDPFYFIESGY